MSYRHFWSSTFNIQHSTFNIQHSTFNIQHSTFNIQHSTFNIQHSTFNIQHSTFNIQHSTFNIQHSTFNIQHSINDIAKIVCGSLLERKKRSAIVIQGVSDLNSVSFDDYRIRRTYLINGKLNAKVAPLPS